MGSLNEFGWLTEENVTSYWQATEIRYEIPHRLRLALSPRSSLGESSTPLRMTYRGFVYRFLSSHTKTQGINLGFVFLSLFFFAQYTNNTPGFWVIPNLFAAFGESDAARAGIFDADDGSR